MILHVLIAMVSGWLHQHQQQVIAYLLEENRVLKARLDGRQLHLTDTECRRLATLAHPLGRQRLNEVATLVTPDTLMRWYQRQIAEALGVSEGAVSQWLTRVRESRLEALRHRPPTGAPRRLSAEQLARLPELLRRGPAAYGFRGEVWTRGRIAAVIRLEFGVSYHPRHVGRLCAMIHWSPQKPARRARQRDEEAIAHWRDETWPAIKKGPKRSSRPSCSSTSLGFIPCPASSEPTPP